MLLGQTLVPAAYVALAIPADRFRGLVVAFPSAQRVPKLAIYGSTLSAAGPVRLRGGIYDDATLALIAQGDEVVVQPGSAPGWIDLPFVGRVPGGPPVPQSTVRVGVQTGDAGLSVYRDPAGAASGAWFATDAYSDGLAATMPAPTAAQVFAVYAATFAAWAAADEEEAWYARLPWELSQVVFSGTAPVEASQVTTRVGWHGTGLDPERGAFAVVRRGGPFDSLVGERLRIRAGGPSGQTVYVYVHDTSDVLAAHDISIPRRAFATLDLLGFDDVVATVTRMA